MKSGAMNLTINGEARELSGPVTVAQYLETMGLAGRYVAAARNGDVLDPAAFPRVTLQDGDRIEVARPRWRRVASALLRHWRASLSLLCMAFAGVAPVRRSRRGALRPLIRFSQASAGRLPSKVLARP